MSSKKTVAKKPHASTTSEKVQSRSARSAADLRALVADIPVPEWKPYVPSKAMIEAEKRAKAIHDIPSLVR